MGRPPLPADKKQAYRVNACFTKAEYDELFAFARAAGKRAGAVLRDLWLEHYEKGKA